MSKQVTIDGNAVVAPPFKPKERKHMDMLMWAITGPIIVYPGGWGNDLPDDIKGQIKIDRLVTVMQHSKEPLTTPLAPEVEAMWYMSSASLEHPLSRDLVEIYMHLTKNWWIKTNKGDLPDFLETTPELNDYQKGILRRLREFIFKKSFEEVKCQHQQKKSTLKNQVKETLSSSETFVQTDLLQMSG